MIVWKICFLCTLAVASRLASVDGEAEEVTVLQQRYHPANTSPRLDSFLLSEQRAKTFLRRRKREHDPMEECREITGCQFEELNEEIGGVMAREIMREYKCGTVECYDITYCKITSTYVNSHALTYICTADCWGDWGGWGKCSQTCGGIKSRTRECDSPSSTSAIACPGTSSDDTTCEEIGCPVDGVWGAWSTWGLCSGTCEYGSISRTRACDSPAPVYGGLPCDGWDTATAACNLGPCPVDGVWGAWSTWGLCSGTCEYGSMSRTRACDSPAPVYGGLPCDGRDTATAACNLGPCPVDGVWGAWSTWGLCSGTCEYGSMSRTRACDSPAPVYGGLPCDGWDTATAACNLGPCPVDGGWATWKTWSACSVVNADVTRTRCRKCINPVPRHGGASCEGNGLYSEECSVPRSHFKRKCRCPRARISVARNMTMAELKATMEETKRQLTVDKTKTTNANRKKISAPDHRTSSTFMGVIAFLILSFLLIFIVATDLLSVYQFFYNRRKRKHQQVQDISLGGRTCDAEGITPSAKREVAESMGEDVPTPIHGGLGSSRTSGTRSHVL